MESIVKIKEWWDDNEEVCKLGFALLQEISNKENCQLLVKKAGLSVLLIGTGGFLGYKIYGKQGAALGTSAGVAIGLRLGLCKSVLEVFQRELTPNERYLLSKALLLAVEAAGIALPWGMAGAAISFAINNPELIKQLIEIIMNMFNKPHGI